MRFASQIARRQEYFKEETNMNAVEEKNLQQQVHHQMRVIRQGAAELIGEEELVA